jgi:hypothetical protein
VQFLDALNLTTHGEREQGRGHALTMFSTRMAVLDMAKFVRPDADARAAEAVKTMRLRSLRLAKEAKDAAKAAAAKLEASSKTRSRAARS